jgi:hypothetical protein
MPREPPVMRTWRGCEDIRAPLGFWLIDAELVICFVLADAVELRC